MNAVIQLWREHKKHANVTLVFDTSGSMRKEDRMPNAQAGATQFIELLDDKDQVSLLPFSTSPAWAIRDAAMENRRGEIVNRIQGWYPDGDTALYDSIDLAYREMKSHPTPDRIAAIVVLTDGADRGSRLGLPQLLENIRASEEQQGFRVFTIKYGDEAQAGVLKEIADATRAKFFEGKPENIREVFKEIATFF
jgi:Ca-activated chloride channel family protein